MGGDVSMVIGIVKTWIDVSPGHLMAWLNCVTAYVMQVVNGVGGIRTVEMLAAAGFIVGFLACLYKIKHIEG